MISPELRARWIRFTATDTPVFLSFLTLSGVLILAFSAFFFVQKRPYETVGVPEVAEVIHRGHWMRTVKGIPQDVFTLRYRYRDADGDEHVGSGDVHRDSWFRYDRGSRLPILYLRDRPDQSQPAIVPASRYWVSLLFSAGLGVLSLLGALALGARGWARAGRPDPIRGEARSESDPREPRRRRRRPEGRRPS